MPTLPSLATVADLETFTGRTYTSTPQEGRAQALLDQASGVIRRLAHQTLSEVDDDVEIRDAPGGQLLILRQLPVIDLTSILDAQDGPIDATEYTFDPDTGTVWRWYWGQWMPWYWGSGGWLGGAGVWNRQRLTITYSHGFAEIPAELVGVCCGMADRALLAAGMGGLKSEMIGGYRYDLGPLAGVGGIGLTSSECAIVESYRPGVQQVVV